MDALNAFVEKKNANIKDIANLTIEGYAPSIMSLCQRIIVLLSPWIKLVRETVVENIMLKDIIKSYNILKESSKTYCCDKYDFDINGISTFNIRNSDLLDGW